jgi:hypothetical protein
MTWFEKLTGFREESPSQVRQNMSLDGETLTSLVNSKVMVCGRLETPSLAELRDRVSSVQRGKNYVDGRLAVREVIANVQDLHLDISNAGSLFQVASQFNLLEMVSPGKTPENGVGIYEDDHTQGPACAIAAGAGTIYRNYFVPVNGETGQSKNNQIDCLAELAISLGNSDNRLWQMRNGYALSTREGLNEISNRLRAIGENELDELRKLLRIGIQWDTQVTLKESTHRISQAYCSALPVAYSSHSADLWEPFARLVLEASYEATICSAILNWHESGNNRAFLTLLGGGAFGNETNWITESVKRALNLYKDWKLDVVFVSYGSSNRKVRNFIEELS